MLKLNGYLPAILIAAGMVFTGMAAYYTGQVNTASLIGDRPTRAEMHEVIKQYNSAVLRELDIIKTMIQRSNNG